MIKFFNVKKITGIYCMLLLVAVFGFTGCGQSANSGKDIVQEESKQEEETRKDVQKEDDARIEDAEDGEAVMLTDTVRWFNASYAVLTEINAQMNNLWDYNKFGGMDQNPINEAINQQLLEEWWGVTDRASADETLDWALTEGHRTYFAKEMQRLEEIFAGVEAEERVDFLLENYEVEGGEDEAIYSAYMYQLYEEFGVTAIDGWDYCRAMNLLSYYYAAGYYTEEEALDKSLEIAKIIQTKYDSWDDLIASYMRGYEYWQEASAAGRIAVYEDLKTRDDNPYAVDFKTTLEKTW